MTEPTTCGQGLAHHAAIPHAAGELLDAMADNLETHLETLDLSDAPARRERDAYIRLAAEHRRIAARLEAVAEEMASYHDLPMARHDEEALHSEPVREAFARFTSAQRHLAQLTGGG